ncbi:hypothetical protein FNF27_00013 [Cafeteria roenbergensis]|uniref:GTP-binding protein n=1 Tax=Cafeteria roenbergensis TaxID=33653 RepID=A0A5A8D5T9_CAFRO|nr:hypothetical protein FNF29_03522 [Cafeteria roenbergensis]KAA0160299.1 hypothetical protein FNF28_05495 [Cafeteria roenbergensis]KAA0161309.1 hypothetical protein FNF31_03923 [Cafeteria roenbergensis]KAA0178156.1 hypothetical protein FNF27_00013 [Cafeteria roenbergensis]|eukprot:KAA0153002.1 hypothetical protein FNF29_03522 [Cafeteria roenbergensis]
MSGRSPAAMRKKVLLMGRSGAGKTSMRSIIFANLIARETSRLSATLDVEYSTVRFMGDLVLNIWDCGGQEVFLESYFEAERDSIFRDVAILIYVFDIKSAEVEKEFINYERCIKAISRDGQDARVFCLVHKMDVVPPERRKVVFHAKESEIISRSRGLDTRCYPTSIWDETLYKAWSSIVYALVPNVEALGLALSGLADACDADEVVLFEKATFLVVSSRTRRSHRDKHRFEKMSNIVKQLKLACMGSASHLDSVQIANSRFRAILVPLTATTIVMIVTPRPGPAAGLCLLNAAVARPEFDRILLHSAEGGGAAAAASAAAPVAASEAGAPADGVGASAAADAEDSFRQDAAGGDHAVPAMSH